MRRYRGGGMEFVMDEATYTFAAQAARYLFLILIYLILLATVVSVVREYRIQKRILGGQVIVGKLRWTNPPEGGEEIFNLGMETTVGSAAFCDICISAEGVVKRHAQFMYRNGIMTLNDLYRQEEPLINGVSAPEQVELMSGDEIWLGQARLLYEQEVTEDA